MYANKLVTTGHAIENNNNCYSQVMEPGASSNPISILTSQLCGGGDSRLFQANLSDQPEGGSVHVEKKGEEKPRRQREHSLHQLRRHIGSKSRESPSPEVKGEASVGLVVFWQHAPRGIRIIMNVYVFNGTSGRVHCDVAVRLFARHQVANFSAALSGFWLL
eukprot:267348-Pelagomonas_calceolata.AAC.1